MSQILKLFESLDVQNNIISLVITLAIVVLTLALFWFFNRKPSQSRNVLVLGLSNSGKTSMFCQLVYKSNLLTQISITPNNGVVHLPKNQNYKEKKLDLVDVPGQSKVRAKFFGLLKKSAKAIVFVIDSSVFQKEAKDVAEFMYQILTDDFLMKAKIKMLIVCNKQDIEFAKGETFIKNNLEKEIELLRKISSSALESTGTSGSSGKAQREKLTSNVDKQFEFKDLKYFKVDFAEANSLDLEHLNPVKNWLHANVN